MEFVHKRRDGVEIALDHIRGLVVHLVASGREADEALVGNPLGERLGARDPCNRILVSVKEQNTVSTPR